jgi:hypothetical protein
METQMITFRQLIAWRAGEVEKARAAGKPFFLMYPDEWYPDPHWFCENGHVSGSYLKTDGSDRCLECRKAVILGPMIGETAFRAICLEIQCSAESSTEE